MSRGASPCADEALRHKAVSYYALLCSGSATPQDHEKVRRWRMERPEHEQAWQRLERLRRTLEELPADIAAPALRAASVQRRRLVKSLALLAGAGTMGYASYRATPWRAWTADYRTSTGGFEEVVLADGTRVSLDTGSAMNVRYTPERRLLQLLAGQVYIVTASDPSAVERPFVVQTEDGEARPLGTRFTARKLAGDTRVAVYAGSVRLSPADDVRSLVVPAGQSATFGRRVLGPLKQADESALAWRQGSLSVLDWRLEDFCRELGRYRPGYLGCDASVADLRVSGTYPLHDTDLALTALAQSFPVRVRAFGRYWVRIERR